MRAEIEITCPQCQNIGETSGRFKSKKCYYNSAKDVWHCYHCGAKGSGDPMQSRPLMLQPRAEPDFEFTEELLKAYQDELIQSDRAIAYLQKRFGGVMPQEMFGLGYDSGRDAIVIPIRNFDDELIGVKYRFLVKDDPKYISEPGSKAGLYFVDGNRTKALIVEGEIDSMAARLMGFEGMIIALQTNRVNQHTKERITSLLNKSVTRIYLAADNDEAGTQLKDTIYQLPIEKSKICELTIDSVKDLAELLETEQLAQASLKFVQIIKNAQTEVEKETFKVFDRLNETLDYLCDKKNTTGWSTGFRLLDQRLGGGLLPYTLTALSAPGKTGKTTFLIQLIFNLISQNIKVGFISLEMSPTTHVIPSLLSIAIQKNVRRMEDHELGESLQTVLKECQYINNLVFFDRYGTTPSEDIDKWVRAQHQENGVNVFFLDHVGYSLKDIKDPAEHSLLSKRLRSLTRSLPIHIGAIVQPKQLPFNQKQVTKHDLYGSVTWSQDINQLITMERSGDNQLSIRLTDSHSPLARPSDEAVLLFYTPDTCTLSE